ncbi:MAG: hypothetical protein Q9227_007243 [Pyrenula ochraceoflavens]
MAPIRRYLRITRNSVLECRIFLENPADSQRWLLRPSDPALPKVVAAVKPLVLPKLREENERVRGKGKKKKKATKDIIKEEDFEVSVFLTEIGTRHYVLTKNKTFQERKARAKDYSNRLTEHTDQPIAIADDMSEDGSISMDQIPPARADDSSAEPVEIGSSESESEHANHEREPEEGEEKKKSAFRTTYEGFSIWGWVLCLFVTRTGVPGKKTAGEQAASQALMEEWIAFTQHQQEDEED